MYIVGEPDKRGVGVGVGMGSGDGGRGEKIKKMREKGNV